MAPPPEKHIIYIEKSMPILHIDVAYYTPLVDVMFTYETTRDFFAINDKEQAHGGLQIRPCRIEHYNILNGTNYTVQDCLGPKGYELSKKVFLYFTNHDSNGKKIPYKTWERAAKDWNGSGKKTEEYWKNLQELL